MGGNSVDGAQADLRHVHSIDVVDAEPLVVLSFRSAGEELEMLRHAGHLFFVLGC